MVAHFPAFCPTCGLIFQSLIVVEGVADDVSLEGNRERCPRCGAWAELPDGSFNIVGDTIHVLSASGLTRERLRQLAAILDQVRAGTISNPEAVDAITSEAPPLIGLVERYGPRMRGALLFFLGAVVQVLISQGVAELRDDSATKRDVEQAVEQAVERCRQRPR